MVEKDISQRFTLKDIEETRKYFVEEIEQDELMSNNRIKVCAIANYIEHFVIWPSTVTGCISIFAFASLLDIPVGITSSAIGLKSCAIVTGIKKYKPITKKRKKKHDKRVLLAKAELNNIELLICKALIN